MNTNPSLEQLQQTLGDVADRLRAAKAGTDDPETIKAINHELIEVNHRITMVGALLFHQQTAAITAAAQKVEAARAGVADAIRKLDKIKNFIKAIAGFLGLVDRVIDLAKAAIP
jgi:4-hydroxy-3-methylbut-2-en-1-yl diphosphate synthase IspG/GcpE